MISFERMQYINKLVEDYGIEKACIIEDLSAQTILDYVSRYEKIINTDNEIIFANVRLSKSRQRLLDSNRIERKAFREYARIDNALEALTKELITVFDKHKLSGLTKHHKTNNQKGVGVIHLSDLHLNELVWLANNKYDFNIASQRLQKFATEIKALFRHSGFKTVVIADTGDKLNSDRRLDELLSNATNRSQAQFIAVEILKQFILDIAQEFNVVYSYVLGNESRVKDEMSWNEFSATDSYDYNIVHILKIIFENEKGVTFVEPETPNKTVIGINGKNFLLIHGMKFGNDPHKNVKSLVRLYADKGVCVDYVLFGHIHEALITDKFSRGSSLVGANAYSEDSLLLTSLASQNIHFVFNNGDINSMRIDLQNTKGISGYNVSKKIEAYNAKSAKKTVDKKTIFEVVV